MCDTILTAIINHLTPNLVGARRRRALPQSCRIPQREPQRLRYFGENMKVLSFPIRNHVGWGNWRFQISHVPVFFNFRTQQILHNRLLLLALRLLSPNRDTSTKVSQYFSTFCQTLLSFYFPNIVCFFLKKSLDLRNSHSLGWSLPPVPLWIHHTKETVSMATRLLKKKKKKTWKHLLPTSFPGAPCTVVCKAWKLHLRQETLLSIGLAMNYNPTTNYLVYFPIN